MFVIKLKAKSLLLVFAAKLPVAWSSVDSGVGPSVDGFNAARFEDLVVDGLTTASEWIGVGRASIVVEVNNFVITALLEHLEESHTVAARITALDEVSVLVW